MVVRALLRDGLLRDGVGNKVVLVARLIGMVRRVEPPLDVVLAPLGFPDAGGIIVAIVQEVELRVA